MAFKREETEESKPELLPMIDVVFLLLTFFLVVTTVGQLVTIPKELPVDVKEIGGKTSATLRIDVGYNRHTRHSEYYLYHLNLNPAVPSLEMTHYNDLESDQWPRITSRVTARTTWSQPIDIMLVEQRLRDLKALLEAKSKTPIIVVRGERDAPFAPILKIMGICKKEGIEKVSFVVGNVITTDEE